MRNLFFVNLTRLKKSRIFCGGTILSMLYSAFVLTMNYREVAVSPDTAITHLNWYFLSPLAFAGVFCAIFCSMFVGTEYSDGTIRNKLMVGHTRGSIYFANFIVVFLANVLVYAAACVIVALVGIPMFGWNLRFPAQFAFNIFSGILMLASFAGIFTMLAMLITNKAASVAACMIIYAFMLEGGTLLRIAVYNYYLDKPSADVADASINPIVEFLYDFLPTGQSAQIVGGMVWHPYRLPLYSIVCIILTIICGMTIFSKKDIK